MYPVPTFSVFDEQIALCSPNLRMRPSGFVTQLDNDVIYLLNTEIVGTRHRRVRRVMMQFNKIRQSNATPISLRSTPTSWRGGRGARFPRSDERRVGRECR